MGSADDRFLAAAKIGKKNSGYKKAPARATPPTNHIAIAIANAATSTRTQRHRLQLDSYTYGSYTYGAPSPHPPILQPDHRTGRSPDPKITEPGDYRVETSPQQRSAMASYIPEPVRRQAAALNDAYNPLSAAQRPSQAHGKYSYAKGMCSLNPPSAL